MNADMRTYRAAHWIASFVVAAVLLSGCHKIIYPGDFAVSVYRFHLVPDMLVNLTALYIPWLEIVCAACLLFIPPYRVAALWIILFLLIAFTAAIAFNLWRGSVFGCGCFGRGASDMPLSWMHLVRNAGLIGMAGLGLAARKMMKASDKPEPSNPAG